MSFCKQQASPNKKKTKNKCNFSQINIHVKKYFLIVRNETEV